MRKPRRNRLSESAEEKRGCRYLIAPPIRATTTDGIPDLNIMTVRITIDFHAAARRIVELTDLNLIREQLVLVWNARGAADIAKIDIELPKATGASVSGPYVKFLDRALRTLDR
jgi:hypothetical protein